MSRKRVALILLALPLVLLAGVWFAFDPDSLRPRLVAEAERATGRAVTIDGPLRLTIFPRLAIAAEGVTLANLPDGTRPAMLTLRRAEAEVALWPLLRGQVVVAALRLTGADLLLERQNWIFARPRALEAPAAPGTPNAPRPPAFRLDSLVLTDARVAVAGETVEVATATWHGPAARLAAEARWRGQLLRLTAEAGNAPTLVAEAATEGMTLRFDGTTPGPLRWDGAEGTVTLTMDRTSRLAPLLPAAANWPAMEEVSLSATLRPGPAFTTLRAEVGRASYGPARLEAVRLAADSSEAPLTGTGSLRIGQGRLALALTGGPAANFWPGRQAAEWPLRVTAEGEGLAITANATLLPTGRPRMVDVALGAADLGASGRRLGIGLPGLTGVTVEAGLRPEGDGLRLSPLRLDSAEGDLAGDAQWQPGAPPRVTGQLRGRRLDLDATVAAMAVLPPAPTALAAPQAPLVAPPLPRPGPARAIPDLPLPTAWLASLPAMGEATLGVGELVLNGVTYRDLDLRAAFGPGTATLDPLDVTLPGGRVALRVEATAAPARLALRARTDALDTAVFEAAYGLPRRLSGPLEIDLDLAGPAGALRGWLAGTTGHLGLAMLGGRLEPAMVAGIPPALLSLLLPGGMPPDGIAQRCTALRLRAGEGAARIETLLVEGALGRLGGTGTIGLADEALNLRLLPDLRIGQVAVRAPVGVVGTLAAPRVGQVDARGAAAGALGALLSLQRTPDRRLGALAEELSGSAAALPDCAAALTAARGGRPGPVPPPREAAPEPAPRPTTQDVLRGLLGR